PALTRALGRLDETKATLAPDVASYGEIMSLELRGLVRELDGAADRGLALVRQAAHMDDSLPIPFGPPLSVKPPHELAGEMLYRMPRYADARDEFALALKRTPSRALALLGMARTETALGHKTEADRAWRALAEVWTKADADLPDLALARKNGSH